MLAIFTTDSPKIYPGNRASLRLSAIGTLLAKYRASGTAEGQAAMFDRDFFTSKLGVAALVSIAAMVTFNALALTHQLDASAETAVVVAPMVELA